MQRETKATRTKILEGGGSTTLYSSETHLASQSVLFRNETPATNTGAIGGGQSQSGVEKRRRLD